MKPPLILASSSVTRLRLLQNAGLAVEALPAALDEAEIKASLRASGASAAEVAQELADLKAKRISCRLPEAMVLGADQMLECDGLWFDKPVNRDAAAEQLTRLSGKSHRLLSALALYRDGASIWTHRAVAQLTLRALTASQIDAYLDRAGDGILTSVGAYHLEGLGINLFERVEGDFFSILGIPVLPLLAFLRLHGIGPI